jgi:hypothetical protein
MPGTYPTNGLVAQFNGRRMEVSVRRVMWSTVISLGMRFGQLWPR